MKISSVPLSRRVALSTLLVPLAGAVVAGCGGASVEKASAPESSHGRDVTRVMEEIEKDKAAAAKQRK